jgi:cytoskeletal protein CcmA (bactofilin family)
MKILIAGFVVFIWGLLLTQDNSPLNARYAEEIRITSPIEGDIYLAGRTVFIDAPVHGDVVVAGGTVTVNDSVTADVLVAGGHVTVNGFVGDDVRAAAGTLTLSGEVAGDVLAVGAELVIRKDAVVDGEVSARTSVVDIRGTVEGAVKARCDRLDLRGVVDGPFDVRANKVNISGTIDGYSAISANSIEILPGASFGKDVRYWNNDGSLNVTPAGVKVKYDPSIRVDQPRWQLLGFSSMLMMLWYLGTALLAIWTIAFLFSKTLNNAAAVVLRRAMSSMGYGFLFFIAVPALVFFLVMTILALPIAVLLAIAYILLIVLATAITAVVMSNWINRVYYNSSWGVSHITLVAFLIFIGLKLFTLTPLIGPVLMALMACMAVGAIVITTWTKQSPTR